MTKEQHLQRLIRLYRQETGVSEWDMHDVAKWSERKGYRLPKPPTPLEMLAKELSRAARAETKVDPYTGQKYRVNHAFTDGSGQMTLWVDINEAPRKHMKKSAINRREQVVGDLVQLTLDLEYWNRKNPNEEPLEVPLDFTLDVEWRKNGGDAGESTAA